MNAALEISAYLRQHEAKPRLRFITCGSVDDGKSTLIGRLLFESKNLFDDQLSALERDSKRHGTQGEAIDYALLLDGLEAEREQGITIDVAHRYFTTPRRSFIVADTPGHKHYTRNMVTGASTSELAVLLVDAEKGLLEQTRRHGYQTDDQGHEPRVDLQRGAPVLRRPDQQGDRDRRPRPREARGTAPPPTPPPAPKPA